MESVVRQQDVLVQHVVIGDSCPFLADRRTLTDLHRRFPNALVANLTPAEASTSSYAPARTARARNVGIFMAKGDYIAHLDDDNEFERDHLRRLLDALHPAPTVGVGHSWRRLYDASGLPFVPTTNPWERDRQQAVKTYEALLRAGVFSAGSNMVRDVLVAEDGTVYNTIDSSELMVRADLHREHMFREHYSSEEQMEGMSEDSAFGIDLVEHGIVAVCTMQPTLRYHLGGYSTAPSRPAHPSQYQP
jgi:GT2 family glycosyltransferase